MASLDELYFHGSTMEALVSLLSFPYAYNLSKRDLYEKVIRDVMDGNAGNIHPEVYQAYSDNLRKAVGGVFRSDDYGDKYFDLQAQLQSNVSRFAAYKTYHLTEQLKRKREEWTNDDDFKKVAKAMMNTFNRYQAAEYNTATARARTAKQWTDFTSDPIANELYPNLRWLPSRSATPREEHIPFYGLVLPKTDPFWQHNQPGNLWNCKCDWEETDAPAAAERPATICAKGLDGNPAVTGEIFTQECTYFKNAGKKGTEVVEEFFRPIKEHHNEYMDLSKNPDYNEVKFDWGTGAIKATHKDHRFESQIGCFGIERGEYEKYARDALFRKGYSVILQKEDTNSGTVQPDGFLNGVLMDIKGVEGNPMWSINRACTQKVETCILYFHDHASFSEDDVRNKFLVDLPDWRNKQDYIHDKEMSVKTVVCVVNRGNYYDVIEIKKPEE